MGRAKNRVEFIHLRAHSSYSLLEGALKIPDMVDLAQANGMPALAITDRNNLFGALEYSERMRAAGIQPIIGCTLAVDLMAVEGGINNDAGNSIRVESTTISLQLKANRSRTTGIELPGAEKWAEQKTGWSLSTCAPIFQLMELIRNSGVSALIATHNMDLARDMDRVLSLENGKLTDVRIPA